MTDRSGLLSDSDFVMRCQRSRRYKSQVREVTTTPTPTTKSVGSKRKSTCDGSLVDAYCGSQVTVIPTTPPSAPTPFETKYHKHLEYTLPFPDAASNVAAAHAVSAVSASTGGYHHHSPHAASAAVYPYNHGADHNMNGLSYASMPQNLFTAAIDHNSRFEHASRSFLAPDFLHYTRHAAALGTYYPEYHAASQYSSNGFFEHMTSARSAVYEADSWKYSSLHEQLAPR